MSIAGAILVFQWAGFGFAALGLPLWWLEGRNKPRFGFRHEHVPLGVAFLAFGALLVLFGFFVPWLPCKCKL